MSATVLGSSPCDWWMDRDEEGHRDYTIQWKVQTSGATYGPNWALAATGLPTPGASLNIGASSDSWAFYTRKGSAKLMRKDSRRDIWLVTTVFSTRPLRRCSTNAVGNPLLEPNRWSGGVRKYTIETDKDKDGNALLNSAGERYTGPIVQDTRTHSTIELEMNVSWIDLAFLADYCEAVNNATWWGSAARTIKCTDFDWREEQYGSCTTFFNVRFSFEINPDTWDLKVLDEGDMVAIPGTSPTEFRRAKDDFEENVRVLLDGSGNALASGAAEVYNSFRCKKEKDFSTVGWPSTIGN